MTTISLKGTIQRVDGMFQTEIDVSTEQCEKDVMHFLSELLDHKIFAVAT